MDDFTNNLSAEEIAENLRNRAYAGQEYAWPYEQYILEAEARGNIIYETQPQTESAPNVNLNITARTNLPIMPWTAVYDIYGEVLTTSSPNLCIVQYTDGSRCFAYVESITMPAVANGSAANCAANGLPTMSSRAASCTPSRAANDEMLSSGNSPLRLVPRRGNSVSDCSQCSCDENDEQNGNK